jgi:DNA primase
MIFDAIRFLTEYNIDYSTYGKNVQSGWVGINCPMPDCGDISNHGGFNLEDGHYNCWRCGGHQIETVIRYLLNCTYNEALRIKDEFSNKYIIRKKPIEKKQIRKVNLPGCERLLPCDRKYLEKRGFDPDYLVNRYQIRGSDLTGDWRYRVIIPIIYHGRIVSFQGRDVTNKQFLRYRTLEKEKSIVNPKSIFYGWDNVQGRETIAIVEGITDCWKMGGGFVASLGKNITPQQIKLLVNGGFKRVFWLIDCNDERSKEFAEKAAKDVTIFGIEGIICDMTNDKDPGELTEQEVKDVRKEIEI